MSQSLSFDPTELDACADDPWAFDPEPTPRRGRRRRGGSWVLGLAVALLLHAGLLLLWRVSRPPVVQGVAGQGGGAGGISLTLVRGSAGGAFAPAPPSDSVDPARQAAVATLPQAATEPEATSSGLDAASSEATGAGHGSGDVGEAADGGGRASTGAGYDPGAFASLAPLSFIQHSDPGLADQVKRCLKAGELSPVTLTVVIDDQGAFLNAYKAAAGLPTKQPPGEAQAISDVVEALKACSPYHDLAAGLGRPLTLVVSTGQASP